MTVHERIFLMPAMCLNPPGRTVSNAASRPTLLRCLATGLVIACALLATPAASLGQTSAPSGLFAQSIVGNLVTLRWNAPAAGPAPSGYLLDGGVFPGQMFVTVPTGSAHPVITFAAPNGAYYLRIRAVSGGQPSAPSNEIRIFVNWFEPPSAPQQLLGHVDGSAMVLSWRVGFEGGTPFGYLLDVSGPVNASLPVGPTDRLIFPAVPSGTYTFAVRAGNPFGLSPASNPVTLRFPGPCTGAPAPPANFLASNVGNIMRIMWDPAATGTAPTHFQVNVTGSFTGSFPYYFRDLVSPIPPGTYAFSVAAANSCGVSAPTAAQTVVIP